MPQRLFVLAAGLVLFSAIHSALAVDAVREWATRRLGGRPRGYRLAYNLIAIVLFAAILFATRGDYPTIWRAQGLLRGTLLAVQALAAAGVVLTLRRFDVGEFLGLRGEPGRGMTEGLETGGVYGLCRHPLYFFVSLFFSAWPTMDLRWLIVAAWFWSYSYFGSILEERKLLRSFGAAYRAYQATHPRLLPLGSRAPSRPHRGA